MPDYDAGFKIAARESGRELAQLGEVYCDVWTPITGEVHAAERLADRAFRARRGTESFVVYMEAYTRWEAKAPWSVLAKSGLLSERERLPCVSLIYVLLPRGHHPQDETFRLVVEDRATQQVWFREICLWELEPRPSWETSPGLMSLYPLFAHRQSPEAATAQAARAIRAHSADIIRKADLLTVLALFGKLATPGFDPIKVIGREAMKESPLYQEILAEGRAEGRAAGLEAGRAAGLEAGREEAHRADILRVLGTRFGKRAADGLAAKLQLVHYADDLAGLFEVALVCPTLTSFRQSLVQQSRSR